VEGRRSGGQARRDAARPLGVDQYQIDWTANLPVAPVVEPGFFVNARLDHAADVLNELRRLLDRIAKQICPARKGCSGQELYLFVPPELPSPPRPPIR
jgi:hypothetical protein